MKSLKYIAVIIVCATAIILVSQIKGGCSADVAPRTVVVPNDSNYMPTTHETYKPPSLPFSKKKAPVRLPSGVKEKDVSRVISLQTNDFHSIDIVEARTGEIYVPRDSTIRSVTVTTFEPPLFSLGMRFGIGVTIGHSLSPAAVFAPIEWNGWLQAPIITADMYGVGAGMQAQVYHNVNAGVTAVKKFDIDTEVKIIASYNF